MSNKNRWSSYRQQQTLMENFRKFLNEEESEENLQEDSGEEEGEHIKSEGYGKMPPMDRDDGEDELDEAHCNTKAKRDDEKGDDDKMKGRDSLTKPGHIDYEKGKIGGKTV